MLAWNNFPISTFQGERKARYDAYIAARESFERSFGTPPDGKKLVFSYRGDSIGVALADSKNGTAKMTLAEWQDKFGVK
jgi:hypothetical protein